MELRKKTVLIIGDVMLDRYIYGSVRGQSPEAPVPIIDYINQDAHPGGAANVARNIASLGSHALLLGIRGNDKSGDKLLSLLSKSENIEAHLIPSMERCTTTKTRIIADGEHQLRFDEEDRADLHRDEYHQVRQTFESIVNATDLDLVILQDYNKGLLHPEFITFIMQWAAKNKVPVMVDPKKKNVEHYKGAFLLKPNLLELQTISGKDVESIAEIQKVAQELAQSLNIQYIMTTLGKKGNILCSAEKVHDDPAIEIQSIDVCGAGDAVISSVALALANGWDLKSTMRIGNIAGAICCEHLGVYSVSREELMQRFNPAKRQ